MSATYQQNFQVNDPKSDELQINQDLSKSARNNFIKKVYTVLTMQLIITTVFCVIAYNVKEFLQFQLDNPAIMWVSFGLLLFVEILIICTRLGKSFPWNMLLLLVFTLCESYTVSFVCSMVAEQNGGEIVLIAAAMTLAIFSALSLYACTTKKDFTVSYGILLTISTAFMMLIFVSIFTNSAFWNNLICTLGVIVFGIYVIIDTQMIMGDKRYGISLDDYIIGALILYLDIIQIFLYILRLLSRDS